MNPWIKAFIMAVTLVGVVYLLGVLFIAYPIMVPIMAACAVLAMLTMFIRYVFLY